MFPSSNVRDITQKPALAIYYDNSTSSSAAGADGLITINTTEKLDGFTLSSSVITCLVPGCYEVNFNMSAYMSAGAAGVTYGYRKNGGTSQWSIASTSTLVVPCAVTFGIYLAYRDTLEFRQIGGDVATTATTYYPKVVVKQISTFQ